MAVYQDQQDELAHLQELSNKYEPEATVPTQFLQETESLLMLMRDRDLW